MSSKRLHYLSIWHLISYLFQDIHISTGTETDWIKLYLVLKCWVWFVAINSLSWEWPNSIWHEIINYFVIFCMRARTNIESHIKGFIKIIWSTSKFNLICQSPIWNLFLEIKNCIMIMIDTSNFAIISLFLIACKYWQKSLNWIY